MANQDSSIPLTGVNRVCTRCNIEKSVNDFPQKGKRCKACKADALRAYRAEHPEKCREMDKRWAAANRDKRRASNAKWAEANSEYVSALHREYQKRDWAKHLEQARASNKRKRFERALKASKSQAKRRGHMPCLNTPQEIASAFTGYCQNSSCGRSEDGKRKLHMDHCHDTGAFRGWLCYRCNQAIGLMDNSPEKLRALADFLEASTQGGGNDAKMA